MYYGTLLALDDFDAAEKLVKGRLKRRHKNSKSTAFVDLGSLYLHFGMRDNAMEAFEEALELLPKGRPAAVALANAFIKLDELDMALATYQRAEKLGTVGFDYELANLQGMRGDFEGMVGAYMSLLATKPNYLRTVQNSLNRNLRLTLVEDNRELVRTALLRAIQANPDNVIYPELLVWHFNQIQDFASAFVHAKSLDLRLDEGGTRMMELGHTAQANGDRATALKCYEYVAGQGPNNPYFFTARNEVLQGPIRQPDRGGAGRPRQDGRARRVLRLELARPRHSVRNGHDGEGPGAPARVLPQPRRRRHRGPGDLARRARLERTRGGRMQADVGRHLRV